MKARKKNSEAKRLTDRDGKDKRLICSAALSTRSLGTGWQLVGLEVPTGGLRSDVLLTITPCRLAEVSRHFGRTYHLRLQGKRAREAISQQGAGCEEVEPFGLSRF
jgi:hypothetical protein